MKCFRYRSTSGGRPSRDQGSVFAAVKGIAPHWWGNGLARVVFACVCATALCPAIHLRAEGLDARTRADFEWFRTLSFPDLKGCPCVRVENGSWSEMGEQPHFKYIRGFLIASNADTLTVFTTELVTRTFSNALQIAQADGHLPCEVVNLRAEANNQINALRNPPVKEDPFERFGEQITERAEVFILAWACWRNGLDAEAQQLYNLARKMPARLSGHNTGSDFREAIEKDLAHALMWRAIVSFGVPSIPRSNILNQLEVILKNYPHSEHCERARQTAQVLQRMIAEDEAHARQGPVDLAKLPVEARVRELIFRLRDQNGHQITQPGACDIFYVYPWDGTTNTPAHQLVQLGYAAVPRLIAALDSDTFTRSVGFWRGFVFSHTVLTVGDCAEEILQRITGKSFAPPNSEARYMSEAGTGAAARKAAEAWWAESESRGELQNLVEGVAAGDKDSPAQAGFLCQRFPELATPALVLGAQAATNADVRAALVEHIGKLGAAPGTDFLKAELLHGPSLAPCVAAAWGLWQQGDPSAIKSMVREWQTGPERKDPDDDAWKRLIEFLSSCDSPEAVSALTANLRHRPVEVKFKVIECLGVTDPWFTHYEPRLRSPATLEAVEQGLVGSLEDTEQYLNMHFGRNEKQFSDPRICDMAAWFLSERWPDRYKFDVPGSLTTRDRQRLECLNAWRKAHDLTPVPIPEKRGARVPPSAATRVTAIDWAPDSAVPSETFLKAITDLKDKPLDPGDLVGLLTAFARQPATNAAGLELTAIKDADLMGVRVVVRLVPGKPPTESQGWDVNQRVVLGDEGLHGSSGGGILEAYNKAKDWEDLAQAARQAIAGPPETPFEISARIAAGKFTHVSKPGQLPRHHSRRLKKKVAKP